MSAVIAFLEKMGREAHLRHAAPEEIAHALGQADVEAPLCSAILARDAAQLKDLLGIAPMFYVQIPTEEEEGDEDDGNQPLDLPQQRRLALAVS